MRLLLDTHTLLWWFTDDPMLSPVARAAITADDNALFASAASAWEVATKQRLGKLGGVRAAAERWPERLAANGITSVPITTAHALRAGGFAAAHRDPFDRMLAAQAELEGLTLVTVDPAFAGFPCRVMW